MTFAEERRQQPRVALSKEIWIGQDGIFSRTADRISNMSVGGVFIETTQSFSKGSVVALRFPLGESKELICCAAIVRNIQAGTGLGVEFLDLSAESRLRIADYLSSPGNSRSI